MENAPARTHRDSEITIVFKCLRMFSPTAATNV